MAGATWLLAGLFIASAWPVARRGMSGVRRWIVLGSGTALIAGCGLVVYAGIRSKGFGPWMQRQPVWDFAIFGEVVLAGALLTLPAIISSPDWVRFRDSESTQQRVLARLSPLVMVPVAVVLAFVGALLGSASLTVLGVVSAAPKRRL